MMLHRLRRKPALAACTSRKLLVLAETGVLGRARCASDFASGGCERRVLTERTILWGNILPATTRNGVKFIFIHTGESAFAFAFFWKRVSWHSHFRWSFRF
jgi:hypothetical protein